MTRYKPKAKKLRLAKRRKQTRWAPIWIIPKIYKGLRRVHPVRFTRIKRNWRKQRTKV